MSARRWDVWSIDRANLRGLVVNEGVTENAAKADAGKRNATAERLQMPGTVFVALPQGRQPAESDLPPAPAPSAAEMAARARNKDPLHDHEGVNAGPWNADTMSAHLRAMHGVDDADEGQGLEFLAEVHGLLNHGAGSKAALIDAIEAAPRVFRRQEAMSLDPCKGHEGEFALQLWGRTLGTQVCLTAADRVHLAALLLPESEGLKALQDIWSANLGPGGRRAVEAGHAAGYKTGVQDMEATPAYRSGPVDAGDVEAFLARLVGADGLAASAGSLSDDEEQAVRTVLEVLTRDKTAWNS